jgi:hypothetical protein
MPYHSHMRRFIFILMIALLPLRGWMGEAMATEMAAMTMTAKQTMHTLAAADLPLENSVSDCDMHKTKGNELTTAKPSCNYCQACHATGMATTVEINSFDKIHYAQPLVQAHSYTSASLALGQKPPIL